MPYENEHSCRLKPPNYKNYARKNCYQKHDGKCIDFVFGIKGPNDSELQSMRYNKDTWSEKDARSHCKEHDGTFEPAKKKESSFISMNEYRIFPIEDLRVENDEKEPVIRGYAAVFDQWSEDLGGFREIIRKGAFKKTLKDGADVRALFNHDPNIVLGRSTNGTLELVEDNKGLAIEIKAPTTAMVNDLVIEPIKRGDINQMSFAFKTVHDKWGKDENKTPPMYRELLEAKLYDVSPVTFPAYPQTTVDVREILKESGIDYQALAGIILCNKYGLEINEEDRKLLERSIEILNRCLPEEPEQEFHSTEVEEDEVQEHFIKIDERIDRAVKEIL